jgi:hypothetical protein
VLSARDDRASSIKERRPVMLYAVEKVRDGGRVVR